LAEQGPSGQLDRFGARLVKLPLSRRPMPEAVYPNDLTIWESITVAARVYLASLYCSSTKWRTKRAIMAANKTLMVSTMITII